MKTTTDTVSVRVETPDGTLFCHIDEVDGKPTAIRLNIGKAGTRLMAWASVTATLVTLALEHGVSIYEVLESIVDISSDKLVYSAGIPVKSGPDGLATAILQYLKNTEEEKFNRGESSYRRPFIREREAEDRDS